MSGMSDIRVMIVDDSALVRQVLKEMIDSKKGFSVIATAANPDFADRYLEKEWPDVIILDIEMPKKDGLTYLKEIMERRPTPVVICSGVTEKNTRVSIDALSMGAVSVISKPQVGMKDFFHESEQLLLDSIRSAAKTNLSLLKKSSAKAPQKPRMIEPLKTVVAEKLTADVVLPPPQVKVDSKGLEKIVVIGASAGGTQAIETVLRNLPVDCPGIVIVQHMPEKFTNAFAERLNGLCDIEVKEAEKNDVVKTGRAIIAMGNKHMTLQKKGKGYIVDVVDGPLVSRHRPAVDVLFRSAAKNGSSNILGIILTGMGDDGATGMLEMKNAGCFTIAQDKETCLVYGMPKVAKERGGVQKELSLGLIPQAIINFTSGNGEK